MMYRPIYRQSVLFFHTSKMRISPVIFSVVVLQLAIQASGYVEKPKPIYSSPGKVGDQGTWNVIASKDKGWKPQVHGNAQGNIYTSPNGNWWVGGSAQHDFGRGRKPSSQFGLNLGGVFKRSVEEFQDEDQAEASVEPEERAKRSPQENPNPTRWGVDVYKDLAGRMSVQSHIQGNLYTSPNGLTSVDGRFNHAAANGMKPIYGGGLSVTRRFGRSLDDETEFTDEEIAEDQSERAKRSPQQDRGGWAVTVNKDKGRGPQVRTEVDRNIYTSPNGNWRVDGQGHHEFGKGRKPDYGVGVQVTGRFRRSVDDDEEVFAVEEIAEPESERAKRSPQQDRGGWAVTVNKDKGRGPQVRTEVDRNIYTSPNGNWRVDGQGHHEFGKGRKPDYGVGVQVTGRFRRSVDDDEEVFAVEEIAEPESERAKRSPQQNQPNRGGWGVTVNKDKGRGPQIRTEAQGNIYTSPKGNWRVDGHGHHEFGKGRKPEYGAGVKVTGRFRRSADEEVFADEEITESESDRQKRSPKDDWSVTVNKDKGRGPQVRTEAGKNIYTSPNGKVTVDAQGHHEFGKGRKPDYGGSVRVGGRWRREIGDEENNEFDQVEDVNESERLKRSPKDDWSVTVNKDKGRGPQVRTEAGKNIYTSPNGKVTVDAKGHHEFGKGRKPDYGGSVRVGGRWRREIGDEENNEFDQVEDVIESERLKRSPKDDWSVTVNKDKGRGPQVRTEAGKNIYTSPNGKVTVDAQGHHEFGKGRKPDYGGSVRVGGRWRREITEEDNEFDEVEEGERTKRSPQGSWGVSANANQGRGPQIRTEAQGTLYKSPNGNFNVGGHGYHEFGKGRKPDYGVGLNAGGNFNQGRATWGVDANKNKGFGPQVRTDVGGNFYTSPNGNWKVNGNGYHEFGSGRKPDYGVGVQVKGRFRRSYDRPRKG